MTRRFVIALLLVLAAVVAASPAWAGEALPPASVDDLVAEALDRAPSVAALRARLTAARERVAPAGALPDPMLGLSVQAMGLPEIGPSSQATLELSQEFPAPGTRRARREAASASADATAADLDGLRRRVAREVRTAYADLYALDRERETLAAAGELLDLLAGAVAARYAAGQDDQGTVLLVQLEAARVRERGDELAAERAAVVATLNRLLDRPGDAPIATTAALPEVSLPAAADPEDVAGRAPEVRAREAEGRAAERGVDEARRERYPGFLVGVGGGVDGDFAPVAMARFGITLPVWERAKNAPRIRAAEAERDAAREDLRDARASARAALATLVARAEAGRRQVARAREEIVPRSRGAFDAARAAYLSGRGDLRPVIEAFSLWLDARRDLARREADLYATWAAYDELTAPAPDGEGAMDEAR